MNEYLTPMTKVIHQSRGTIDKYMGDAIMAFWGAPLGDDRHVKNALVAAKEMVLILKDINKIFEDKGWPKNSDWDRHSYWRNECRQHGLDVQNGLYSFGR